MTGTRVDMHVKVLDEEVVERAKAHGLDVLVYAPHFTRLPDIRRRAERFSDDDLLVVPARELFTGVWHDRRHLLAVGLEEPIPDFITLDGALAACRRQDAAVLVPHPGFLNVSLDREDVLAHADAVDDVEAHNAKCLPHQNRRSRTIARATGYPGFASSYAHLRGTIGTAWTQFEADVEDEADLVEALQAGAPRRLYRSSGRAARWRGLLEFAHLGYENSWQKLDRVLLSGMDPTHPGHIAYGGRFDDVRVY